ncbi:recombinase family protein [Microvirga sp. HBU67558]|uniref:recombinase family protein n=1 Tax=Microvirga TaxID=186650 RepID=UPI001B384126|nr:MULTISPECIES: recombinase family protein [unclassified Microvirga]MBQ0819150.1 recombinase family protein [Microvirga sp. HBU67558]
MAGKEKIKALAYLRTSSSSNIGVDKDSDKRQRSAIQAFAKRAGYEIGDEFYDQAVSGADAVDVRPGFKSMMERLRSDGIQVIIVETANRFARDLIVQETGYEMLKERGITLIAADSPESFISDTPTAVLIRQVLGSVSQFEKAMLVDKLRVARTRLREKGLKVEGRKSYQEIDPKMVALAKKLRRYPVHGRRRSLSEIASELAKAGYMTRNGKPFAKTAIAKMVAA